MKPIQLKKGKKLAMMPVRRARITLEMKNTEDSTFIPISTSNTDETGHFNLIVSPMPGISDYSP